jgi:DNA helicase-2/ATP-dependent DNA helicase PcrA
LRASGALDYDDLLLLTYRLFLERPKIAEFYQRQYKYICIDEAQDLNEAQYRLLVSLCGATFKNVLMVGDPKQAIYVWNGADPKYLDLFQRDFEAEKIVLTDNFRCSRKVVEAAQRLDPSYIVEGQLPVMGTVEVIECADETGEAQEVVRIIKGLGSQGHPDIEGEVTLGRIAVLGRNRFVFKALEEELKNEELSFYKRLSSAAYQSESDVLKNSSLLCVSWEILGIVFIWVSSPRRGKRTWKIRTLLTAAGVIIPWKLFNRLSITRVQDVLRQ